MIPKVINYVWLGGKPLSNFANVCVLSWKEKLPGFEIKQWNEKNLDLDKLCQENKYFAELRKRKLYAYMSDYLRLYIIYHYGGIYMDTDVEVIRSFEDLLDRDILMGHASYGVINSGFIAAEPGHPFIKKCLEFYENEIWNSDLYIIPDILGYTYKTYGFDFPLCKKEILSPRPWDQPFDESMLTDETRTIHWYGGSWSGNKQVVLFLRTKNIHNPVKKKAVQCKKLIGFYLRKWNMLH